MPSEQDINAARAQLGDRVVAALGESVLAIEHVGSTSVPGLWAKPMIDIDLTVADSADEDAWLPDPEDRARYAEVKREVAARGFTDAMLYNNAKGWFVYDLYEKVFAGDPEHEHDPHPRSQPDRLRARSGA